MARCKRILLSIQSNLIPISLNWAGPLREAFLRAGVDCVFYPQGIHPATEATLLDIVRPDCVLAINQFPSDVLAERRIKHILWLQDDQVFGLDYANSKPKHPSDIVYFMDDNLRRYLSNISAKLIDILMFGADRDRCGEDLLPPVSDFSFLGYIPARSWLSQDYDLGNGISIKLLDLFPFVIKETGKNLDRRPQNMKAVLKDFLKSRKIAGPIPPEKESFIQENVLRAFYRWTTIVLASQVSSSIRLYGPNNWQSWGEFASYYKGESWTLDNAIEIFKSTKVNLHNGASILHPRVFECLGAGGFLMTNRVRNEPLDALFVDGEHLVRYDQAIFVEVATRFLRNDAERDRIRRNAVKFIRGAHTWDHRVAQILRQIDAL